MVRFMGMTPGSGMGIKFYGYLPAQSRPYMSKIYERLVMLGYIVYGFGDYGSEW